MAKNSNPFTNFDVTKVMADFNPSKLAEEFSKAAGQYKLPGMNMEAIVDSQKRNIEALAAANKTAIEGMQTIYRRQAEIMRQMMDQATAAVEQFGKSGTPQEVAAKQADFLKDAYGKAFANMRELAELATKSSNEACETINSRISESLDEMKSLALKSK
ncbi:MAG: phasin family protein [Rhodospirillales bacterium]|nr:phasin family protein [Rhodospirillales bacterium]